MTIRRLMVALLVFGGLCVWGYAHCRNRPAPSDDPIIADGHAHEGGTHDDALARWRTNQSRHWRHVAIGNHSGTP